jgi:hypothetical protein
VALVQECGAGQSTGNLHLDWYSKRGHFTRLISFPIRMKGVMASMGRGTRSPRVYALQLPPSASKERERTLNVLTVCGIAIFH